jgi:hypothetical protein
VKRLIQRVKGLFRPFGFVYVEIKDGKPVHALTNKKNMSLTVVYLDKIQQNGYLDFELHSEIEYDTEENVNKRIDKYALVDAIK